MHDYVMTFFIQAYHLNGSRVEKNTPVAVNFTTNKAAFAVGRTALSSEDMYMAGRRGKGVAILHCAGT